MGWARRRTLGGGLAAVLLLATAAGCASPEQRLDRVGQDVWSQVRTLQVAVRADREVDGITTPVDVVITEAAEGLADAEQQVSDLPGGTARRDDLLAVIGRALGAAEALHGAIQRRDASGVDQVEHTLGELVGRLEALGVSR